MRIGIDIDGVLNDIAEWHFACGSKFCLENNINSGFRFLKYDNYIIFYQITKETILIVRILHRLQNYVKQLL